MYNVWISSAIFFGAKKFFAKRRCTQVHFEPKMCKKNLDTLNLKSCGWVSIIRDKTKTSFVVWRSKSFIKKFHRKIKFNKKEFCPFFIQNVPLLNVKCWLFYNRLIYFYQIWTLMYLKNLWRVIAAATTSPGCLNNSPLSSTVDSSGTTFFLVGGPENQTKILAILKNNHL